MFFDDEYFMCDKNVMLSLLHMFSRDVELNNINVMDQI
jgi:hypothetical protein